MSFEVKKAVVTSAPFVIDNATNMHLSCTIIKTIHHESWLHWWSYALHGRCQISNGFECKAASCVNGIQWIWVHLTLRFCLFGVYKSILWTQVHENFEGNSKLMSFPPFYSNKQLLLLLMIEITLKMQTYCELDPKIWRETWRGEGLCPQVTSWWKSIDISLANA